MPTQLFANNAASLLDAVITDTDTVMTVTPGDGALFPTPSGGDWFNVTLELGTTREIVRVTARSVDSFTIVRAQDGSSAVAWVLGTIVSLRTHAGWLDTVRTVDNLPASAIGDVFGPGASVDGRVVVWDGTDGNLLQDPGITVSGSNTGDQIISDATISLTDLTVNDVSTSRHGFAPKATNVGNFLRDDGVWADIGAGSGDVVGPASAVDLRIPIFDGVTGKLLQDSGTSLSDLGDVDGPGSSVDNRVAFFDGVSGKLIKDSGLLLSGSNTGDHQAAGSWTPALSFGGANVGMAFSAQVGTYTRFHDMIYCTAKIVLTALGSSTGAATINLPFTAHTDAMNGALEVKGALNMLALTSQPSAVIAASGTDTDLLDWGATGQAVLDESNFSATSELWISGFYRTSTSV